MVEISWKIELWSRLGALWAPSWRQDGPRVAPRVKINEKCSVLVLPVGSEMEPKSEQNGKKNIMKNRRNFHHPFGCEKSLKIVENPFENGPQNEWKNGTKSSNAKYRKCASRQGGNAIFDVPWDAKSMKIRCRKRFGYRVWFRSRFFSILGRNLNKIGRQMGPQSDKKIDENLSLFFNEILMDFRSPKGGRNISAQRGEPRTPPPPPPKLHLQSYTCKTTPAKLHLQSYTCKATPAKLHLQSYTCKATPPKLQLHLHFTTDQHAPTAFGTVADFL